MIQVVGVSKRFGPQLLFEDLTWHIRRGERIGLVGPNGCGKTTLLRIIAGQGSPDDGRVVRSKGVTVGLLEQEQHFTSERTVLEEVEGASVELQSAIAEKEQLERQLDRADERLLARYGEVCDRFDSLGGYRAATQAAQVLGGLGFSAEELHQPASAFSGGWRMRIALARLLLTQPDVLLLDEPSNHLDLESLTWLEGHLGEYPGAIVTVSHDRYFLNRTVSHIADLTPSGVRVYTGNYDKYQAQVADEHELEEKRYKEQQAEIERVQRFIDRWRYDKTRASQVQSRVRMLEKLERIELTPRPKAMRGFHFPQPGRSGRFVVELEGVRKAYGEKVVYDGLDLVVERQRKIALVGVNGAGKTTLLRILAQVVDIEGGTRKLGHNTEVGYFAQHQLEALDPRATVLQEMEEVADITTYPLIRGLLGAFLFGQDDVDKVVGVLSGGERARLALCRLLLRPVALMLMDEPTAHLDLASRGSLEDALQRYQGTLIVVSHDRYFINEVCDHVLEVHPGGRISWYPGNYDEYHWKKMDERRRAEEQPLSPAELELQAGAGPAAGSEAKVRKRREAEERQRVYKATRHLRDEAQKAEELIEADEARLEAIDEELGDPGVYQKAGRAPTLLAERADLEGRIARAYERWETLELEIEKATEVARG